jgi:ADP-ribose pyrophosphatase YjhB (NUDIX family)
MTAPSPDTYDPQWLRWAKQLQAIAQNGLTYAENHYDRERYLQLRHVAAEMFAAGADAEVARVLARLEVEEGYATPKVDVRGAVFRNGKILLVRELADQGRWTLPGGWADPNDSPSAAVEREIYEEAGLEARAVKLIGVYDRSRHPHDPPYPQHVYKLFFLCEIVGGALQGSHETGEGAFFTAGALPELSIARVTPGQIARCFAHLRDPVLPTEFD